jgi:flagellar basal-body rod protein FlgC
MSESLFAISRSALDVEHQRLQVVAQNLANAGTTRTATGAPFQPSRLISGPRRDTTFTDVLDRAATDQSNTFVTAGLAGVQTYGIERVDVAPRRVYDPSHPHADAHGFVSYPGIDQAGEMATMVQTLRVYEANVVMFNAARSMYMRALDLGSKG